MNSHSTAVLIVLGLPGKLRSQSLDELSQEVSNCVYVPPRFKTVDRNALTVNESRTKLLTGRKLSDADVSCALTHKRAVVAAETEFQTHEHISWALIAEDDADIDLRTFQRVADELNSARIDVPVLVKFYSAPSLRHLTRRMTLSRRSNLLSSRHWLAGAVCYAMNRAAVREILPFARMPVDNVADWPIYYSRLNLLVSGEVSVSEVTGPSTIGKRDSMGVFSRILLHSRQIRHLGILSRIYGLPRKTVMRHLITTPLLRDLQGRFPVLAALLRVF